MNILIIGSGGRECAIARKTKGNLYCYSNYENPYIKMMCEKYFLFDTFSESECEQICVDNGITQVIIGSEKYLATNIVDLLEEKGIFTLAPNKQMARIETSKIFARQVLKDANLNLFNPDYIIVNRETSILTLLKFLEKHTNQVVVKPDKPVSGKGVKVFGDHLFNRQEIIDYVFELLKNEKELILEKKLIGKEFSLHTITDGEHFIHLNPVVDFKRLLNDNKGPNTGSMGCITDGKRLDFLKDNIVEQIAQNVNKSVLQYLNANYKGTYKGFLYGSFIVTSELNLHVIEFNARLGDPEAIPLMNNINMSELLLHVENMTLNQYGVAKNDKCSLTSYLVPKNYPNSSAETFYFTLDNLTPKEKKHIVLASVDKNYMALGSRTLAIFYEDYDFKNVTEKLYALQDKIMAMNPGLFHARNDFLESYIMNDSYKTAGVNVEEGNKVVKDIASIVQRTYNKNVLNEIGAFGGCYDLKSIMGSYKNPVLVSSIDGVGTKSIFSIDNLGVKKGLYNLGQDIVNHSINDILVQGARPLYFLDYIATSNIKSENIVEFVRGVSDALQESECVLIGGETAEMPNIYLEGRYDFVGCMVGVVEKDDIITGKDIKKNDVIIGIQSSGPHTNGYSLIRKIVDEHTDQFDKSFLEECCRPHRSYLSEINKLIEKNVSIHGLCHVTGGGFDDNIRRIIPKGLQVKWSNFEFSPLFKHIEKIGNVKNMMDVFNCGVGMLVITDSKYLDKIQSIIPNTKYIGTII